MSKYEADRLFVLGSYSFKSSTPSQHIILTALQIPDVAYVGHQHLFGLEIPIACHEAPLRSARLSRRGKELHDCSRGETRLHIEIEFRAHPVIQGPQASFQSLGGDRDSGSDFAVAF